MMIDGFYRAFEDLHRGSRELIKERLQVYVPFIQPLCEQYPAAPALDLGCGRGEWLEVLTMAGFTAAGVDLDEGMLSACHDLGLSASKGEAVAHLGTLPDNSQAVVTAFHVVEHISFEHLKLLVSETLRVLKPGGLLIMETPNPENITVATRNFYLDPTHQRPIPQELLSFVPEYYGFKRVKTIRLQESKKLAQCETLSLQDVFQGASPDYAVVAQKKADPALMAFTASAFEREYGLALETLSARYENAIQLKIRQIEIKAQQAEAAAKQAESAAQSAESRAQQAKTDLHAVYHSRSWRITRPLRWTSMVGQWFVRGGIAWLTFAPMSRPWRVTRQASLHLKLYVAARPRLKALAFRCLAPFPGLKARLKAMGGSFPLSVPQPFHANELDQLSPSARQIYLNLKAAIEQRRKEEKG